MASFDGISSNLHRDLKNSLRVTDDEFEKVHNVFDVIKKSIEKNYLAHLKTAIEDYINDKKKAEIIQYFMDNKDELGEVSCDELNRMVQLKQYRPFTILLAPVISKKKARTTLINKSALITYDPRINKKQLRVFLAHEFGHIVIKELLEGDFKSKDQNLSNLFSFLSILDKDDFYNSKCKDLTHRTPEELLATVANLTD